MSTAKTDLHDPRIRALGILAGSVVYAAILLPELRSASAASQFGVAAVALLSAVIVFSGRLTTNADDSTDGSPNPAVTIGASLAAIVLFQFGLGALAPALRDAIGEGLLVLVVGGCTGLLVGGTLRTVRDVVG